MQALQLYAVTIYTIYTMGAGVYLYTLPPAKEAQPAL